MLMIYTYVIYYLTLINILKYLFSSVCMYVCIYFKIVQGLVSKSLTGE